MEPINNTLDAVLRLISYDTLKDIAYDIDFSLTNAGIYLKPTEQIFADRAKKQINDKIKEWEQ